MYNYAQERPWIFTDEGQIALIKAYKNAIRLINIAGAASGMKIVYDCAHNTFKMMALLDRLVEMHELREVTGPNVWENRIFVLAS
jgi:hypothetical protein